MVRFVSPILADVIAILSRGNDFRPKVPPPSILPAMRFREDLGLDSLALLSLLYELQEAHPDLPESALASWITVEDLLRSVEQADAASAK